MSWMEANRGWLETARRNWKSEKLESLQLRSWLDSEIAWDGYDGITMEGALQCAVVLRETGRIPGDVFSECPVDCPPMDRDIQIPIADAMVTGSNVPIALVTHAMFSPDAKATMRAERSRPRAEYYQAIKVNTAEGSTKAVNGKIATVTCCYLDFWCIGDRSKLETLLPECCQLGASRVAGMGSVRGWEILSSDMTEADIINLRTRPYSEGDRRLAIGAAEERFSTLRAPYWHQATRMRCLVPVQRVC